MEDFYQFTYIYKENSGFRLIQTDFANKKEAFKAFYAWLSKLMQNYPNDTFKINTYTSCRAEIFDADGTQVAVLSLNLSRNGRLYEP